MPYINTHIPFSRDFSMSFIPNLFIFLCYFQAGQVLFYTLRLLCFYVQKLNNMDVTKYIIYEYPLQSIFSLKWFVLFLNSLKSKNTFLFWKKYEFSIIKNIFSFNISICIKLFVGLNSFWAYKWKPLYKFNMYVVSTTIIGARRGA